VRDRVLKYLNEVYYITNHVYYRFGNYEPIRKYSNELLEELIGVFSLEENLTKHYINYWLDDYRHHYIKIDKFWNTKSPPKMVPIDLSRVDDFINRNNAFIYDWQEMSRAMRVPIEDSYRSANDDMMMATAMAMRAESSRFWAESMELFQRPRQISIDNE